MGVGYEDYTPSDMSKSPQLCSDYEYNDEIGAKSCKDCMDGHFCISNEC